MAELAAIDAMGGAIAAIESGDMKRKLVESNTRRLEAIERGEQIVVGVNAFTDQRALAADGGRRARSWRPRPKSRPSRSRGSESLARGARRGARARRRCRRLRAAAASGANIMPASIEAAKAGATTGEWGAALRAEFGEYRAPTGVSPRARQEAGDLDALRGEVQRVSLKLGRRLRFLSASRASTAIPTAPSRSRCARPTPAWTSSTTASG